MILRVDNENCSSLRENRKCWASVFTVPLAIILPVTPCLGPEGCGCTQGTLGQGFLKWTYNQETVCHNKEPSRIASSANRNVLDGQYSRKPYLIRQAKVSKLNIGVSPAFLKYA